MPRIIDVSSLITPKIPLIFELAQYLPSLRYINFALNIKFTHETPPFCTLFHLYFFE